MSENIVLKMSNISKTFPGVKALSNVDFTLREGEIHALMGENGAGKSTLIKVLTGVHDFQTGEIYMVKKAGDKPELIVNHSPQEAQQNGISTVYQEVNLCPNLTVAENLFIGREPRRFGMIDWRTMNRKSTEVLKNLDIHVAPTQSLDECSLAIQQMIAIARAVDMKCRVLILDEPTSSLDDDEVQKLFVLMRKLRAEGVGIIFVTHFLEQVYEVCDRITVLRNGELVGEYEVESLPRVKLVSKMMGKDFDDLADIKGEYKHEKHLEPLIEAKGLGHAGTIRPFDLTINKGEVIGLTGLLGSGRSELVRAIYGADKADSGVFMICFSYFLHHRCKFLIFSCHITVIFLLMRELTIRAIFKSLLIIFEISAAFVSKGIKRAIAEQTVKVLWISSFMAWKILTFLMAEISVFFVFPIFFLHISLLISYSSKQNILYILFRNAPKSNAKKESRLQE